MIMYVLAIRDRSANVFGTPHFHPNIGAAIRSFGDEVQRKDDNNVMFRHPEDFDLYLLGSYDDNKGAFECEESPKQLAVGKDYKLLK